MNWRKPWRNKQALDYAQNLELDAAKYRALVEIITGYARQGQFAQAISLSQTLEADSYQQYLAQSAILAAYVQRHEYESALGFVEGIPNTDNQDSIARSLAEAAWRSGRYDIALEKGRPGKNVTYNCSLWNKNGSN
ncbi:tetratricopeptide repeat protein [Coleofasciculus sp.]|uniref:tetratricopeptide repeat protein n=1 Tax=Coleofasciculus sp. TaxID=3100458 RepID=UPI003A169CF5